MIETGNIDEAVKRIYTEHQQRKVRGREEEQIDKEIAKKVKSYQAVSFDLEAVLPTPCSLVSQKKATVIRRSQQPLPLNPVDQDDQSSQKRLFPELFTAQNHSQSAITPVQPINSPSHLPDILTPFPDIHDRLTPVNRRPLTDRKFEWVYQRLATLKKTKQKSRTTSNNVNVINSNSSTARKQLNSTLYSVPIPANSNKSRDLSISMRLTSAAECKASDVNTNNTNITTQNVKKLNVESVNNVHSINDLCSSVVEGIRSVFQEQVMAVGVPHQNQNKQNYSPNYRGSRQQSLTKCKFCGKSHVFDRRKCQAYNVECFYCHKFGHFKEVCDKKELDERKANSQNWQPRQQSNYRIGY
ncbi:unnamed protein product [Mytilus edulis]|uniref:CCHC-type domain-containing protein n=1 Tax=Mytilus edulis TaxID=6550 RepID=A0A8S3RDE0_MYTED|nr:unnamed protein product [Mytilus edulis]